MQKGFTAIAVVLLVGLVIVALVIFANRSGVFKNIPTGSSLEAVASPKVIAQPKLVYTPDQLESMGYHQATPEQKTAILKQQLNIPVYFYSSTVPSKGRPVICTPFNNTGNTPGTSPMYCY